MNPKKSRPFKPESLRGPYHQKTDIRIPGHLDAGYQEISRSEKTWYESIITSYSIV
jgi:hypothetical protein